MTIIVGLVALVALAVLVTLEPVARAFAAELLGHWQERRKKASHRASELEAFELYARSLGGGQVDGEWMFRAKSGRAYVTVDALQPPWRVGVSLEVDRLLDLEIRRPRFSKQLRVAAGAKHVTNLDPDQPDIRFDVRRAEDERGEIKEHLFSHAGEALTDPLAALLYRLGANSVIARNGRLGVTLDVRDMLVERVRDVLAALEAVGAAYARRPEIAGLIERYLWLDGASPRCPYCHVDIPEHEPDLTACGRCRTVHHEACFAEHGGCTLLGCGGRERAAGVAP